MRKKKSEEVKACLSSFESSNCISGSSLTTPAHKRPDQSAYQASHIDIDFWPEIAGARRSSRG